MEMIVSGMLFVVLACIVGQIVALIYVATHKPTVGDRLKRDRAWMTEMADRHDRGMTR